MTATITYTAGIVEPRLLGETNRGITSPVFIAAHIFVRPISGVHRVGGPDRSILAAIVKDHIIDSLFVARRT